MSNWAGPLAIAVKGVLEADTTVKGIVSTRVFPHGAVQTPTYPYIAYVCPLTDRQEYTYGDAEPQLNYVRFQIDGYTTSYSDAVSLYDAVFACLGKATVTVTGWGTAKLFPDVAMGVYTEVVDGVTLWRGTRRYWAMLAQ